jgi:hypothetical protein
MTKVNDPTRPAALVCHAASELGLQRRRMPEMRFRTAFSDRTHERRGHIGRARSTP